MNHKNAKEYKTNVPRVSKTHSWHERGHHKHWCVTETHSQDPAEKVQQKQGHDPKLILKFKDQLTLP